jgi:peptidoglycan pentaglycine glycine transferase (the first glycine)
MPVLSSPEWDQWLRASSDVHILQTRAWGELKSAFGWEQNFVISEKAGAQILFRKLPGGFRIAYIPKGPIGLQKPGGPQSQATPDDWQSLWKEVDALCRRKHAIFLKVEPDLWQNEDAKPDGFDLDRAMQGFIQGTPTIQPPRTVLIDISGNEESWLERMHQKTRYNIRLSQRKDIIVRPTSDLEAYHRLAVDTSSRDGFFVHELKYYQKAYELFHPTGECELFMAYYQEQPLAGIMVFSHGNRAWYFYGASSNLERNRMPAYLVQWEAMRWAAQQGCTKYDMWGIPDVDEKQLEEQFANRSDGLWGVYRFKRGFGGCVVRSAGAWDRVYMPGLYRLYQWWINRRKNQGND